MKMINKIFYNLMPEYLAKEAIYDFRYENNSGKAQFISSIVINIESANLIFDSMNDWHSWGMVDEYIISSSHYAPLQKGLKIRWDGVREKIKKEIPIKTDYAIIDSKIIIKIKFDLAEIKYKKLTYDEWRTIKCIK